MFRGLTEEFVARKLMAADWPEAAARAMAKFLCDRTADPPRWGDLNACAPLAH